MKKFLSSAPGKFIVSAAVFLIVWPVSDLAVLHTETSYQFVPHVVCPLIAAGFYTLLEGRLKRLK